MAMPYQPWRAALVPASFAGCGFYVSSGGFAGGRRLAVHEYPKKDTPFTEDMGRKARRWQFTAYVIGPQYLVARDALIAACQAPGPATLVHPSLGSEQAHCETCNPAESWEKGGFCTFELVFIEAGQNPDASGTVDTQAQVSTAADQGSTTAATTGRASLSGIGSDAVASGAASAPAPSGMSDFGDKAYPSTKVSGSSGFA